MIVFSAVSKKFLPDSYALENVSFTISPGELVVITGPSGSGKTTIMNLLTMQYTPTEGDIFFHDLPLNSIKNSQIPYHRRKIGVVFQDYKLISELNVWENIALPLSIMGKNEAEIENRVTDLLTLVNLTEKAFHFPKQLSGGEAQRISIARALSTGPSVIFADEPTGNLDKKNSLEIAQLLQKINSYGTTILIATHDHDVIDLFSKKRNIVLDHSHVVKDTNQVKVKTEQSKKKAAEGVEKIENDTESSKEEKETKEKSEGEVKSKATIEDHQSEKTTESKEEKIGFFQKLFGRKPTEKKADSNEVEETDSIEKMGVNDEEVEITSKKKNKKKEKQKES